MVHEAFATRRHEGSIAGANSQSEGYRDFGVPRAVGLDSVANQKLRTTLVLVSGSRCDSIAFSLLPGASGSRGAGNKLNLLKTKGPCNLNAVMRSEGAMRQTWRYS